MQAGCRKADPRETVTRPVWKMGRSNQRSFDKRMSNFLYLPPPAPAIKMEREERDTKIIPCLLFLPSSFKERLDGR